jgi:NADPH2:quinone reductase
LSPAAASRRVRAVGIARPGGPEVLSVIERDVRAPGPLEVRIAVAAAAVNPTDIGVRRNGLEDQPPPWVPGMDLAGVVEAVGEGVSRLAVGEEVMAAVTPRRPDGGAQSELVVLPEASAVAVPGGSTLAQAATLPMNGLTALLALEHLGLAHGQTLAVSGGAGLLSSYAIPLAKLRGLRVLADANGDDEALVRSFGADEVLPRGENFPVAVRHVTRDGADGFLDTALLGQAAMPAIRDGGRLAIVRRLEGITPERGIEVREVYVFDVLERTDWLEQLRDAASRGALMLRVAGEYRPERAADAHRVMDAGGLRGRALIVF